MGDFDGIRVNQLGFFPMSPKFFTVLNPPSMEFEVQTIGPEVQWRTIFNGTMVMKKDGVAHGDFSCITSPADYRICIGESNAGQRMVSEPFVIRENPWDPAMRMILEGVRWQRCGDPHGWGGMCHQDRVPLKHGLEETGTTLDVRGGYHQSGDLRCWADGISGSFLAFLRAFSTLDRPWAAQSQLDDEIAWCASYFLKITSQEGVVYDCQFVPIGWGPRDYYDTPSALTAQCNVARLLAVTSRYFRERRPEFATECLSAARRICCYTDEPSRFLTPYVPPVPELPRGTQGAKFYFQDYRDSARGIAARCAMALDIYLATGEVEYRTAAERLSLELVELQVTDGPAAGLFREAAGKEMPGFGGCGYGTILSGAYVLLDLLRELPDSRSQPRWQQASERYAGLLLRAYGAAERQYLPRVNVSVPLSDGPQFLTFSCMEVGAGAALFLLDCGYAPVESERVAQSVLDFCLGENPRGISCVNGIGWRHETANVWGQFFPSTPPIPGGTTVALGGEYDMPAAAMLFLLMEKLRLHYAAKNSR